MMVWLHFGSQIAKCKIWINNEFREKQYMATKNILIRVSYYIKNSKSLCQIWNGKKNKDILRFEINSFSNTDRESSKSENF